MVCGSEDGVVRIYEIPDAFDSDKQKMLKVNRCLCFAFETEQNRWKMGDKSPEIARAIGPCLYTVTSMTRYILEPRAHNDHKHLSTNE